MENGYIIKNTIIEHVLDFTGLDNVYQVIRQYGLSQRALYFGNNSTPNVQTALHILQKVGMPANRIGLVFTDIAKKIEKNAK